MTEGRGERDNQGLREEREGEKKRKEKGDGKCQYGKCREVKQKGNEESD
jgi:hypothetical protein